MNVLIIIDMQQSSFANSDKYDSDGVIDRINRLSHNIRSKGGKVIFIQHDGVEEDGLMPHTPGWEIHSALIKDSSDIIIRKTLNDSFCKTNLNDILVKLEAENVVVSGWATDLCVDSTVRSATTSGFNVVVISDCHTVSDRPHLKANEVIQHHNWVWQNLLVFNNTVQVLTLKQWCS